MSHLNAFTVDVEDYFHVQSFADRIDPAAWDNHESRVVPNTHKILAILDEHDVRGTFFVLGWVADRFPQLVRDIHSAGHELGCHSFWHGLIYNMTREAFREDLLMGTKAIEEITGKQVLAYRAPSFSITSKSLWALDILIEEGFQYDSSIFPIHHDNYGIPNAPRFPHIIEHSKTAESPAHQATRHQVPGVTNRRQVSGVRSQMSGVTGQVSGVARAEENSPTPAREASVGDGHGEGPSAWCPGKSTEDSQPSTLNPRTSSLHEFPPTVHRRCGVNIPVAGGGYFRLYPTWLSIRWLRQVNTRHNKPFVFYIHPWELDPHQPRLPAGLKSRFRHYQNLRHTERKLHKLLNSFNFAPISEALARVES